MHGPVETARQGVAGRDAGMSAIDSKAAPARQECPKSFHDHRDRGDPMVKVYDDWRAWDRNQQRERTPGCGRR